MVDQQLMNYFKFDEADLYANQNGQFTDKQKADIIRRDKSSRTGSRIWGGAMMFIGLIGLAGAVLAFVSSEDWGFRIGFGIGFGIIWPLIWGGIGWAIVASSFNKHDFKLARVQGRANLVAHESYNSSSHTTSTYHELHIGGHDFDVEGDMADVIMQGEEYILYYVDSTDQILSAEHA